MRNVLNVLTLICGITLWVLGLGIYLLTLYFAYVTSPFALVLSLFLPILSQLFWIWTILNITGVFLNLITIAGITWLTLAVLMTILSKRLKLRDATRIG
jgi:hypothetical protein